jgi:hypothetical protein
MNRNLLRPMALFGAVALMLTATAALTLSRATLFASGHAGMITLLTGGSALHCDIRRAGSDHRPIQCAQWYSRKIQRP